MIRFRENNQKCQSAKKGLKLILCLIQKSRKYHRKSLTSYPKNYHQFKIPGKLRR
jgi:hypothetical protein